MSVGAVAGVLTFLAGMAACSGPDAPSTPGAGAEATGAEVPDDDVPSAPAGARLYPDVAVVADAARHDGDWFVLDGRADQVHRIGLPVPRAAAIFVSGTAALAAWYEPGGTRIQLYDLDFRDLAAQPVFRPAGRDRQDP